MFCKHKARAFSQCLYCPVSKTFLGRVPGSLQGISGHSSWLVLCKLHQSLLTLAGHNLLQPLPVFLHSPEGWDSGGGHCWFRRLNTSCWRPVCVRPFSMRLWEGALCKTHFFFQLWGRGGAVLQQHWSQAGMRQFLLVWHVLKAVPGQHRVSRGKCALLSHSCPLLLFPDVWVSLD